MMSRLGLNDCYLLQKNIQNETDTVKNFTKVVMKSRNKKGLNDVTAAPFLMSFSQLPAAKKPPETGQL